MPSTTAHPIADAIGGAADALTAIAAGLAHQAAHVATAGWPAGLALAMALLTAAAVATAATRLHRAHTTGTETER